MGLVEFRLSNLHSLKPALSDESRLEHDDEPVNRISVTEVFITPKGPK